MIRQEACIPNLPNLPKMESEPIKGTLKKFIFSCVNVKPPSCKNEDARCSENILRLEESGIFETGQIETIEHSENKSIRQSGAFENEIGPGVL